MAAVFDYLQGRGVVFTVIPRRTDRTAEGEVRPPAAPDDDAVRTVVVITSHGPALMVVPASQELDLELAAEATQDPETRLASERELDRTFPDYELGTLPPLSMMLLAPMYMDPAVAGRDSIVFAAGRRDISIRMSIHDLIGTDPLVITPLTAESRLAAASRTA